MKTKKSYVFLVLTLLVAFVLSACSNDSGAKDDSGKVTLKLLSINGQFKKGNFGYRQVQEFEKAHPDIKVEVTYASAQKYNDTLLALASSNELPDIIQPTPAFPLSTLLANKWIQPLNGLVSEDFTSRYPEGTFVEGINKSNGKIYTFPRILGKKGQALYYQTDLLEKAGIDPNKPPKTWDEFLDVSKKVTDKKNGVYGYGLSLDGSTGQNIISLAQSLQPTLDNDGFDYQKGKYNYSSPNVIKAIEFLLKLRDAGVIHPNSTNASGTDIQGLFANKKIVFNISGLPFVRVNKFELGDVKKYDATQVPVPEAGVKSRQLGLTADSSTSSYITATTKHKKEAGLLIDWISSKEYYQKQLSEDLLLSPITDQNNDIPDPILKSVSEVYKETVIERPIPESNKGSLEAKKIESTLPAPSVGFGQIVQGAYIGKLKNWKDELVKLDDALNKRLEEAISKAKANGESVSQDQFTFPDFVGQSDYKNE